MKQMNWLRWPLEQYPITLLLALLLFAFGIFGMEQMSKDEFPAFTIRQGVVVAVYPGATAEEVEAQVAKPLERYLFTYEEVKREKTTTTCQNGMCMVLVHLNDNVNNKDEVWSKMKHGLQLFKQQLPSGVLALVANDDFGNTSALLIAIESPERSYRELHHYSDRLADRLRRIPSVAGVRTYGEQQEQISLYVDRQRLQAYGIGQQTLFTHLQQQGLTTMSGSINNSRQQMPIHLEPTQQSEEEIASLIIFTDPQTGKVVRVRDVARVVREYDTSGGYIEQDGHPCVLLSLEMTPGNNIVHYGRDVDRVLSDFRAEELPQDVSITRIADQPKVVATSVSDFLRDLIISMLIIIVVMMLLFPLRSAIVAAITIPLSTFISVGIMYMVGIELNIVTLAALIVVLGMVVDNSIVVIDGYLEYIGKGMAPKEAALESSRQYFMPMMLATLCICVIFYPLLLTMKGAFNDALRDFPLTITINLMVSLVLAVTVIPFLEVLIIKPEKVASGQQASGGQNAITRLGAKHLQPRARHHVPPSLGHHRHRAGHGGAEHAHRPHAEGAPLPLCRPRPVCRGDIPARRQGAGRHSRPGRLAAHGPGPGRARDGHHQLHRLLVAPLHGVLCSPGGGQELRAVHRQHHVAGGHAGTAGQVSAAMERALPRRLRALQAARLPGSARAGVPLLWRRPRLAARRGRTADGAHAPDARAGMGTHRLHAALPPDQRRARPRQLGPAGHQPHHGRPLAHSRHQRPQRGPAVGR